MAFDLGQDNTKQPITNYVSDMKERLQKAYDLASKAAKQAQEKQKSYYDLKVRGNNIEVGDRVMVKVLAFEGKHKLANKWEEDPYIVLAKPNPELPVYVVGKENGEGRKRTLHRNLLLPIGTFNNNKNNSLERTVINKPTPAPRKKLKISDQRQVHTPELESDANDDSSDDELFVRKVVNMPRLSSSQNHSGHSEEHIDSSAGADVENDNVIEEISDTEVDENSNFEQSENNANRAYYDSTFRTWDQSSVSCQQLGAWDEGQFSVKGIKVPLRPSHLPMDQFFWIGARTQQTPWFTHLGCYETPTASVQRDISNETYPTFACYLFCARFQIYLTMGISRKTCYCYDNVQNHRRLGNEQCSYETFPGIHDELYGAPNPGSVVVYTYHQTRPLADANDYGNCASFRFYGTSPVKHNYESCLNRRGIICANGLIIKNAELSWVDAVKRCGSLKANFNGYYSGMTESIKYWPLRTGFYRRSIEKWTPPGNINFNVDNLRSFHCVAVKVSDDGTLYDITYPQLCTKSLPTLCERSTRVDGNWASWGAWGQCPVTCGGGVVRRSRTCSNPPPKHGGNDCVGDAHDTKPCNTNLCPVDGAWSDWSSWSPCSKSCGEGHETKTRTCTNPAPEHGGKDCPGDSKETRACIGCPAGSSLTPWSAWGQCSVTCGPGGERTRSLCKRKRTRTCDDPPAQHGGSKCVGNSIQKERCSDCIGQYFAEMLVKDE
ncbi:uncharacterized protein LOC144619278 [Crassostrea virginica]